MFFDFFNRFLGNESNRSSKAKRQCGRSLRMEILENRELLSVTAAEFDVIRTQYTDLELSANIADYNVIEITADNLTDAAIRAAITEAGRTTANDLIVLRTTASQNMITLGGVELSININEEQCGSVAIVSLGTDYLTLDANQQSRVLNTSSSTVALAGLNITGGKTTANGGGIYNFDGSLMVTNIAIFENTVSSSATYSAYGGGIYSSGTNSTLTVTNSTIFENTVSSASSSYGGGIYSSGTNSTLTVTNSTISGNSVSSSSTSSSYSYGGGIYSSGTDSTLTVTNSTISKNFVSSSANNASSYGGGIYSSGTDSTLVVTNSTISGNSASALMSNVSHYYYRSHSYGGGIYSTDTLAMTNSTISGNSVSSSYSTGSVSTSTTSYGGGVYSLGTLTIINSIIALNYSKDSCADIYGSLSPQSQNNLIGYNPMFASRPIFDETGRLANASSLDLRLTAESRAVNAGTMTVTLSEKDLDGNQRIYDQDNGGIIDIGAYEFQGAQAAAPTVFSTVVTTLNDSMDPDDDEWSLREALYWATGPGTITFETSLTGGVILLNDQLTVNGMNIDADTLGITLDAQQKNRVIRTFGDVTINGLNLINGNVTDYGGGIYNSGALTVTNSTISGNSVSTIYTTSCRGGGIYNAGELTVIDSTISENSVSAPYASSYGGGISSSGTLTVTNSTISANSVSASNSITSSFTAGGGIHSSGTMTVTNSTISGNSTYSRTGNGTSTTSYAGGIYCSGTSTITNSTISENSAAVSTSHSTATLYSDGGGISSNGTLTVTNSMIFGNSVSNYGGGIYSSGTLTVINSTISGNVASYYGGGIYSSGTNARLTVANSTISGNSVSSTPSPSTSSYGGGGIYSSSSATITNSTISGNFARSFGGGIYIGSSVSPLSINNTIIAKNLGHDIYRSSGTISGVKNLIGDGTGQTSLLDGVDGNIVGTAETPIDPEFVSLQAYTVWTKDLWKSWDLHLLASSAAVNAGDNSLAEGLTTDRDGLPRILGGMVDIGAYEYALSAPLVFGMKQTGLLSEQNEYENIRFFTAQAGTKIVFELLDGSFDDIAFFLTGSNGTFLSITASGEIILPETGTYYLNLNSQDEQRYAYRVDLNTVLLTPDTLTIGFIKGNAAMQLYRLNVPDSKTLSIILEELSNNNKTRIYAKYESNPTTFDYDYVSASGFATEKTLTIPNAYIGTWYIMVIGEYVIEQDDYTIIASYKDFVVDSVTGYRVDGEDVYRVSVAGTGFDRNTSVTLIASNGTRYTAQTTTFENSSAVQATFSVAIPPGIYSVEVKTDGSEPAVIGDAVRIESEVKSQFVANLVVPSGVRSSSLATIYVTYKNTGNIAVSAPILILRATSGGKEDGRMTLDSNRLSTGVWITSPPVGFSSSVQIYASGNQTGLILPGESIQVPVYWAGWNTSLDSDSSIDFTLEVLAPDNAEPLDFMELKQTLKPGAYTDAAWNTVWPRLQSIMGSTWGDYVKMLGDIAASLGQSDAQAYGIDELLGVAIQWANDGFNPFGTLVSSTDAAVAGPTAVLSFERSFLGTDIASRFVEGDLGYGWDHNWNWQLDVQTNGDVSLVGPHGIQRLFQVDARRAGTFLSQTGDFGSLKLGANGKYTLTESNGTVLVFAAQGLLESITDLNGNTVTATHTGGKLTKLSDAYGNFLALTYDGSGKITSVTDNYGNVTSYTYDASGKNLVSVTNSNVQTISYAYAAQTTGALAHTLSQITYADGVKQYFNYGTTGSLQKTWADGVSSVSYIGGNNAKNLLNYSLYEGDALLQTLRLNKNGQIVRAEDIQGRIALYEYDYYGRVVKITDESGNFSTMEYDKRGNLVRSVNANGEQLRFAYSSKYDNLLAMTDADGNMTVFHYDNRGNLVGMDRADGTSSGLTYNSDGTIASATNRRGDSFTYTYDVATGRLVESRESGNTNPTRYEYDGNGNITKITEPDGSVTSMRYDASDRLTHVDYPDGKWIEYTYDSLGRQTSIKSGTDYHVKYTYNSLGFLETVLDATQGGRLVTRYEYDTLGRLSKETQGNGTYTTYSYDALGFLLSKVNYGSDNGVLSRFDYGYNQMGLVHTEKTLDGIWTYEYDSIGQMTSAIFESVNSLIENQNIVYTYGKGGKLSSITKNGNTENITRNSQGQITRQGDNHFEYDPNGNVTKKTNDQTGDVTDYKYDSQDRLISIEDKNGKKEYEYDALGNPKSIIDNDNRTEIVTTPDGKTLSEKNSNGETASTIHGNGIIGKKDASDEMHHHNSDGRGSVVGITDSNSNTVNMYSYDPQGESIYKDESMPNDAQFLGKYGTKTTGQITTQANNVVDTQTGNSLNENDLIDNIIRWVVEKVNPGAFNLGNAVNDDTASLQKAIDSGDIEELQRFLSSRHEAMGRITESANQTQKDALGSYTNMIIPQLGVGKKFFFAMEWQTGNFLKDYVFVKVLDKIFSIPNNLIKGSSGTIKTLSLAILPPLSAASHIIQTVQSWIPRSSDPNELLGPGGYGEAGHITVDTLLPYRINFENDNTATAPAQRVDIVNRLSDKLDWSTFQMTQFGFGDTIVTIPPDASPFYYEQTVSMELESGKTIDVLFSYELVFDTGTLYVSFQSLDPDTELPPGAFDGFLPPEDGTGRGMGFVTYTIRAKSNLQTGDAFNNIAEITFDFAETIATNQIDPHDPNQGTDPTLEAWLTIDRDRPTSNVIPFETTEVEENFTVRWSGTDVGSGISCYDIYVSVDGGEFVKWLDKVTFDYAVYDGEIGHTYSFYSVAYDNVGLVEEGAKSAEATVTVVESGEPGWPRILSTTHADGKVTVTWTNLGPDYRYLVYKNGAMVVNFGNDPYYVDESPSATNTYYVYASHRETQKWSWATPVVVQTTAPKIEITSHEVQADGKIKLTWSGDSKATIYAVYNCGYQVSPNLYPNSMDALEWADPNPIAENQYQIYTYYTDANSKGQWTWSNLYFAKKPVQALAAADSFDAFWSEYDLFQDELLVMVE